MRQEKTGTKGYEWEFHTWGEFVSYVRDTPINPMVSYSSARREGKAEWFGSETFEEGVKLALEGWQDKIPSVGAFSEPMIKGLTDLVEREQFSYENEGMSLDIAKFVENEPECWLQCHSPIESGAGSKIIRLFVNVGALGNVCPVTIERRGAAIAALIEVLEYSGYRVELNGISSASDDGESPPDQSLVVKVRIKDADQPLDIGRVIFAIGSPAMLRRCIFAIRESLPDAVLKHWRIKREGGGGVRSQEYDPPEASLYIAKANHSMNYWKEADFRKWVLEQAAKCGLDVKDPVATTGA